jgi:DNA-binding FrmR family transcriptional regulator
MVDTDTYCPDVVVQVASVTRALQEAAVGLLTDHLQHCVMNAARASKAGGQASLGEEAGTIRQVIRLQDLGWTLAQPAVVLLLTIPHMGIVSSGRLGWQKE